jgi:2-polyprenyl-3-methyl-5-hydroxy-6-metoxy-1,4-benzoquinol methylase
MSAVATWINHDALRNDIESHTAFALISALDIINWECPITVIQQDALIYAIKELMPTHHWSRISEYPWALVNARITGKQSVLDVGGADSPFQYALVMRAGAVTNIDLDEDGKFALAKKSILGKALSDKIVWLKQDVLTYKKTFDRVLCISVLEHMRDPIGAVKHLYSLVNPGGRLLFSFDVAEKPCKDFPIGIVEAKKILNIFSLKMPSISEAYVQPFKIAKNLRVMCVYADKGFGK